MTRAEKAARRILDLESQVKDLYDPTFSSLSWLSPFFFLLALSVCHFAKFILRSLSPSISPHLLFIPPVSPHTPHVILTNKKTETPTLRPPNPSSHSCGCSFAPWRSNARHTSPLVPMKSSRKASRTGSLSGQISIRELRQGGGNVRML